MCPACFNIVHVKQAGEMYASIRETALASGLIIAPAYTMDCNICGSCVHAVQLEEPIAHAVSMLNKKGYMTEMSCCGHHDDSKPRAFIKFQEYHTFYELPGTWRQNGVFLESNEAIDRACVDITKWVEQL